MGLLILSQILAGVAVVVLAIWISRELWFEGRVPNWLRPAAHVFCGLVLLGVVVAVASIPMLTIAYFMMAFDEGPFPQPAQSLFYAPLAGGIVFLYRMARLSYRARGLRAWKSQVDQTKIRKILEP